MKAIKFAFAWHYFACQGSDCARPYQNALSSAPEPK